jgi:lipopolysaccharide transport system permease protein
VRAAETAALHRPVAYNDTVSAAAPSHTPVLIIRPSLGWRALDLREVWTYRELLGIFVWRDLKVRYRQTILGALWIVGQPLISMIIFTLLFNRVAHFQAEGGAPYPVFVLSGLLIWNLVANAINRAGNSLIGSSFLISKVYFPRLIIPLSNVLTEIVDFGVAALLLAAIMIWYRTLPDIAILLLPVAVLIACMMALGVGLWIAALNVEYRDIRVAVPFILQLGMYVTPIVYPLTAIPERYRWLAVLNPMTGIAQTFRASLLRLAVPTTALAWSAIAAILLLVSGGYYFRRMERRFADIL